MISKSVLKAKARLRTAAQQLERVEASTSYEEFADQWYLFLVAAKNVYTMLEQGSKDTPQCRQWFGGVKQVRKSDPLLQYLFQARDDDEHGLSDVTKLESASLSIGKVRSGYSNHVSMSFTTDAIGRPVVHNIESRDGLPVLIEAREPHIALMPVTGRGGVVYPPPTKHLGKLLPDDLPLTVGKAGLVYLEALVSEAEARVA